MPAPPLQNDIMVRSEAQQQLFDLNDLDRAIALKRAIADQGLRCAQIVSTGYVTRYKDMDVWTASCSDERQWALFIAANDSVQVRLCDDNEKIGLPRLQSSARHRGRHRAGSSQCGERELAATKAARTVPGTLLRDHQSHFRDSLYSPAADFSLTVMHLPWRISSRQLPSALVCRCPLGTRLPSLISQLKLLGVAWSPPPPAAWA